MSILGQILGYLGLAVALTLMIVAPGCLLIRHLRWEARQRRRRRLRTVTDDLIREIRFFDDQADPRELIG